jgi:HAD superfamily hydrolase (TIGR01458 family)
MPERERAPLAGVRAFLLDLDGTVFQAGHLIPGVARALEDVARRGIARRFVTNITSRPRSAIARDLEAMGLTVAAEEISTAPRAARAYLLERGWTRSLLLVPAAVREEDLADISDDGVSPPRAVVLGDLGEEFTYDRLNRAFRTLLDGAELVTLGRNRYFLSNGELVLDVGAFAAALEYASRRGATVIGKPSPEFFRAALGSLGVGPEEVAIVGDDVEADVGGGQAIGLRGVLVKTGKFRADDLAHSTVRPDAVIESLAEISRLL